MDHIVNCDQRLGLLKSVGVLNFALFVPSFTAVLWHQLNGNGIPNWLANVTSLILVSISPITEFNLSAVLIHGNVIAIFLTGLALRLRKPSIVMCSNAQPTSFETEPT